MLVSSDDVEKTGFQGKGVEMLHLYQDKLWYVTLYNSIKRCSLISALERCRETGTKEAHPLIPDEQSNLAIDDSDEEKEGELQTSDVTPASDSASATTETDSTDVQPAEEPVGGEDKAEEAAIRRPPPNEEEVQAQDNLLRHCFFTAVKGGAEKKLREKDMPILANVFFSEYMLPARPEGTTLEIKRTSYKKFNSFLTEAASKGIIQTKETSPGVLQITAVNRSHEEYCTALSLAAMSFTNPCTDIESSKLREMNHKRRNPSRKQKAYKLKKCTNSPLVSSHLFHPRPNPGNADHFLDSH